MRIGLTGGSGSLGTALIARLVAAGIGPIVTTTRDEFKAEQLGNQYGGIGGPVRVMVAAEGIKDTAKLKEVFRGCEVLIHCAALKRISGSVYAATEMMATNVIGVQSVLQAATEVGIAKVLCISSDKAVESCNLYGHTKAVGECLAVQHNSFSYPRGTRVAVARYGNVINSRGSVIPLWKEQFAAGQSLVLTHKDMVRFMITMDQAVDFVMACLFSMKGGEIFTPILPSARMYDVALAICGEESKILVANQLRPGGEKISEILISQEEPSRTVKRQLHGGFGLPIDSYVVLPSHRTWSSEPYPGEPVPDGFTYRSDTNDKWLGIADLKRML